VAVLEGFPSLADVESLLLAALRYWWNGQERRVIKDMKAVGPVKLFGRRFSKSRGGFDQE